jgi:hypothetical protein
MENKRFKTQFRSDTINKKRQSFSDRICDDLCEVLLSYLSFEDKIRFECVSKQFQKSIFNKQFIIEIDEYPNRKENTLNALMNKTNKFNVKAFESVLKKSKFVNEIYIRVNNKKLNEIILKLIIKYCYYLKSITFDFNEINEQLLEEFGLKFGQKLSQISFIRSLRNHKSIDKYKKLLRLCPNLVSFGDKYLTDLSLFVDSNELLVPKLTSISTEVQSEDIQLIECFAKTYGNSLKSVSFVGWLGINDIETHFLMKQIIHLKNLTKLDLMLEFSANSSQEFIHNLKAIALNCNQLKQLYFFVAETNPSLDFQIFNCLSFFKNLNFLELSLNKNNEESNEISCQSLKELKLLMNLKVENPIMNDIFFEDIDKHLPQLKHLTITVDNKVITDKAMN